MSTLALLVTTRTAQEPVMAALHQAFAAEVALAADGRIAVAMEVDDHLDPRSIRDAILADDAVAAVELVAAWYDDEAAMEEPHHG